MMTIRVSARPFVLMPEAKTDSRGHFNGFNGGEALSGISSSATQDNKSELKCYQRGRVPAHYHERAVRLGGRARRLPQQRALGAICLD